MPTLLREGPYRFFFYSDEGDPREPPHVHVTAGDRLAKFWLTDQGGSYVYVVGADNKAERRNVQLGQTEPPEVSVLSGLKEGETIVVDGIQRVRVGQPVAPGPPPPNATDAAEKGVK